MTALDHQQIGIRIRSLRHDLGWTQEQLAEAADISVPYLSHIERATKKASLSSLARISEALNVTIDFLLFGRYPETDRSTEDLRTVFNDCSAYEKCVMLDTAAAIKEILRKNQQTA